MKKKKLSRRSEREVRRKKRAKEVKKQVAERVRRSRGKRGGFKEGYGLKAKGGTYKKTKNAYVEKRVYRFKGLHNFDNAVDILLELRDDRPRWATYAQIGTSYRKNSKWIGSKVSTPGDTSAWLQGVGSGYIGGQRSYFGPNARKSELWVEVIAMRSNSRKR